MSSPEAEFFDTLLLKINDHYDTLDTSKVIGIKNIKNKNKDKGTLFEYMCLRLLQINAFRQIKVNTAWLFKDLPDTLRENLGLIYKDMGIDIIVLDINGNYLAIQCKYKTKSRYSKTPNGTFIQHQIGWKNLSTFYTLCGRTGPSKGWSKHVVITTASSVNSQGKKTDKDCNICLGTFRGFSKDVWLEFTGNSGHRLNDLPEKKEEVNKVDIRENRLKFLDGLK